MMLFLIRQHRWYWHMINVIKIKISFLGIYFSIRIEGEICASEIISK